MQLTEDGFTPITTVKILLDWQYAGLTSHEVYEKLQEKYKKDFTPPINLDYCIEAIDFFRDKFPYHFIPVTRQVINPVCRTAYLKRTKGVWSKKNFLLEGEITDYMDKMTRKNYFQHFLVLKSLGGVTQPSR